ncbi:MAG: hypothetical protein ACE5HP_02650 [Gemmatimonadota bacterium]
MLRPRSAPVPRFLPSPPAPLLLTSLAACSAGLNGGQLEAILQRSAESVAKRGSDRGLGKGRINVCAALSC